MIMLLTLLSMIACSEDEIKGEQQTSIYGTWQLVESFVVDGVEGDWVQVDSGYTYELNSDGTFKSSEYNECSDGNYEIASQKITFEYGCENFSTGIENPPGSFTYNFSIKNSTLEIEPTYVGCFEGCGFRFKKISEPK